MEEYEKTNREKRLSPRRKARFWCNCCDKDLVHYGTKCSVCGAFNGNKCLKKETNAR